MLTLLYHWFVFIFVFFSFLFSFLTTPFRCCHRGLTFLFTYLNGKDLWLTWRDPPHLPRLGLAVGVHWLLALRGWLSWIVACDLKVEVLSYVLGIFSHCFPLVKFKTKITTFNKRETHLSFLSFVLSPSRHAQPVMADSCHSVWLVVLISVIARTSKIVCMSKSHKRCSI